jgi:hypothetical protein
MRSKFSTLVLASAALAAVALATIPAVAATSTTLNVPFNFTVQGQSLPAGLYSVQQDYSGSILRLQSRDGSRSFSSIAIPSEKNGDRAVLRFNTVGQTHVLESIRLGQLITPKLNKKTRKTEDVSPQDMPGQ